MSRKISPSLGTSVKICGIPCIALFLCSTEDGVEFDIYDRNGYPALWLHKKMSDDDGYKIQQAILAENDPY